MTRENFKLVIVAVFCLLVAWTGPSIAHGVHAQFAHNADKVDGKHAVGAGASIDARKGRLVATGAATGRLPNNIIARAPDAAGLGGFPAEALRAVSVPASGLALTGAASYATAFGVSLDNGGTGNASADFYLPLDHKAGDDVFVDLVVYADPAGCEVHLARSGRIFTPGTGSFNGSLWVKTDGTDPATEAVEDYRLLTYRLDEPAAPGDIVHLTVTRIDDEADTCVQGFWIVGLQFRY